MLEWFFALCKVGQQEFLKPDPVLGCRHIANKVVTWRLEGYSNDRLSSQGLRDVEHTLSKPIGVTRIALLGDSSTEGLQVPLEKTYARLLEAQLNKGKAAHFEVLNFACSSYSTGQQLVQLQNEVLAYKPDITVLLYNRGDSLENVRDIRKKVAEPRPYFFLNNKKQLVTDNSILQAKGNKLAANPMLDFLRAHSCIYGVLSQTNLALSIHEKFYLKMRTGILNLLFLLSNSSVQAAPQTQAQNADPWPVTKALIDTMSQECKGHDSRFVLMTFPNTLCDPEFSGQIDGLKLESKRSQFGFLDLTSAFKSHPNINSLFLQYHFSGRGHQVVASTLAKFLEDSLYPSGKSSR